MHFTLSNHVASLANYAKWRQRAMYDSYVFIYQGNIKQDFPF